jgi:phosphatidylserine/phosphatidylglycerophosphate/cardiolipin synthase-like enzyme
MIGALLDLPTYVLNRLVAELEMNALPPPYTAAKLARVLEVDHAVVAPAVAALTHLASIGGSQRSTAEFIGESLRRASRYAPPVAVWSGAHVPGTHARNTRVVYHELFSTAEKSVWLSTYVVYDGADVLGALAERMRAVPDLRVTLFLNVERRWGDATHPAAVVAAFATRFWANDWPGERRPQVYYDPRALDDSDPEAGVLHAKVVVVDDGRVFMTSANLTSRAMDRNVEAGLLVFDRDLAQSTVARFQTLIDRGMVVPLPTP